jgi:hypothetical protein
MKYKPERKRYKMTPEEKEDFVLDNKDIKGVILSLCKQHNVDLRRLCYQLDLNPRQFTEGWLQGKGIYIGKIVNHYNLKKVLAALGAKLQINVVLIKDFTPDPDILKRKTVC